MTTSQQPIDGTEVAPVGALAVLRRGLLVTPELRSGWLVVVFLGMSVAAGRLIIPVLIQRSLDQGVLGPDGTKPSVVLVGAVIVLIVVIMAALLSWYSQRLLIQRAELAIAGLRTRTFRHIHDLSIADHNQTQRGTLLARVTSDAEALARFATWGMLSWIIQPMIIVGSFVVLAAYSWQLAIIAFICYLPVMPILRFIQRRQFRAHRELRTSVSTLLSGFSETITGAAVIRSYGAEDRALSVLQQSNQHRYRAALLTNGYQATVSVVGDVFGAIALAAVLVAGVTQRVEWGISSGELIACLFLTTLLHEPFAELGETLGDSQEAAAGWDKILGLLDQEPDVSETTSGRDLPSGPLSVHADELWFAYRNSEPVLRDVSVVLPAGSSVAIVGETGSGKTTFANLLCRLADPTQGTLYLAETPLTSVSHESRLASVRMVPQDGFLFDTTVRENIRYGRTGASDDQILASIERLDLTSWVARLPQGLDTRVGQRGESLSVGERQLVALARAALADPGLLVLDEATSAVDPETDRALSKAIGVLASSRTVVSVAHRLSTAESADIILVFDDGRIVEQGHHDELVKANGRYSKLHQAWLGATR